jgi:hypothetical protein
VHDGTDVTRHMSFKSKYNFSNQCYNDIMKLIIDLIPAKHNMSKDLYQYKKIVSDLRMNYEKIDVYEKSACCFERSIRTTLNICSRSRHMKVINEDGTYVTTKVVVKQLCNIPITPRLKRLFLCKEMTQQMRWHKEGIHDSEDVDIMLHHTDVDAWHVLHRFDPKFAKDPRSVCLGLSTNGFQPYSSDRTAYSY